MLRGLLVLLSRASCCRAEDRAPFRRPAARRWSARASATPIRTNGRRGALADPVHGIDVSKYQGDIDWRRVRASGVHFAFIKATEGGDHADDRFADNWAAARAAGMPRGAYHYYYFCRTAAEQAAWFMNHVPKDPAALPPFLDLEWTHKSRTCTYRPAPETVRREARFFLQALGIDDGKRPVIYTTVDFFRDNESGVSTATTSGCAPSPATPRRSTPTSAGPSGNIPAPAWSPASTAPPTSTSSPAHKPSGAPGPPAAEALPSDTASA